MPHDIEGFVADDIVVYDWTYKRSVVNLLPKEFAEKIRNIPFEYQRLDEQSARKKFYPTPAMNQLRAAFWLEYNVTQTTQKQAMNIQKVYSGIVTKHYFYEVVIWSKEMLAWMLIPPQSYQAILNEAWDTGMSRMREILELPIMDKRGRVSTQTAQLIVKVWTLLDQRKFGGIVQKNMSVMLTGQEAKEAAIAIETNSMEALDRRLRDLKKKMAALPSPEPEKEIVEAKPIANE